MHACMHAYADEGAQGEYKTCLEMVWWGSQEVCARSIFGWLAVELRHAPTPKSPALYGFSGIELLKCRVQQGRECSSSGT